MWVCVTWMMAGKGIAMMGMEPRGSRVRRSRRCGLLRRSASASAGHTRTKTNAGLVAVVAVSGLILAGCGGGTTNSVTSPASPSVTSPTASPDINRGAAGTVSCAKGRGAANTCVVGDTGPGGGKVFYVLEGNPTGSRYMEAAPNTWNGGNKGDPSIVWCSNTNKNIPGSFGYAIGTGKANTDNMVAACKSGAANSVRTYTGGGLAAGSWSLPSKDELKVLWTQQTTLGGFAADFYWSSSQNDANDAWRQSFANGGQSDDDKFNPFRVRPVRAF